MTARRWALVAVPAGAAVLVLAAILWRPAAGAGPADAPADLARLPAQGDNVVAVAVDLSARAGDGLDEANLRVIARVDAFFRSMEGLRGYSSPLRATVVRASEHDIVVRPFIPPALLEDYDAATAQELRRAYPHFPEIHPYWSADFRAAAFYLELGSRIAPTTLVERLVRLQRTLAEESGAAVHFTGVRPIAAVTGSLMVRDLRALLPLVVAGVVAVFLLTFGTARGALVALAATACAAAAGVALFVLLAGPDTPLLILAPVLAGGLLSDYALHAGYHLGWRGDGSARAARAYLAVPLALTAATTGIGFLSLLGLGSTAHLFVAVTGGAGALAALVLALWWLPLAGRLRTRRGRAGARHVTRRLRRLLVAVLLALARHRTAAAILLLLLAAVAALHLGRLQPEPYPLYQLPAESTIVQAERIFNREFAGTVPFALELDAGEPNAFVRRGPLEQLGAVHRLLATVPAVGHQQSLLSVVERIHRYFNTGGTTGDATVRGLPETRDPDLFERIIAQYLLFFSASASPAAYAALVDDRLGVVRLHGILRYDDHATLLSLQRVVDTLRDEVPAGWRIRLTGPAQELLEHAERLRRNWLRAVVAGGLLIFGTVLAAFRSLRLAVLSLVPAGVVLLAVTALAPRFGVRIDDYTVIALAITVGLTVDYTIHVINALRHAPAASLIRRAHAVVRGCGVPTCMSFLTSVAAFLSLAVSSFAGAVHFGVMIATAIAGALVLSLFIAAWELARDQPDRPDRRRQLPNARRGCYTAEEDRT